MNHGRVLTQQIDKRHLEATVYFAVNHIPYTDPATLEKFLELVNATGNFGPISHQEIIHKMTLLKKHIPNTCDFSLLTLVKLLEIQLPVNLQA